MNMIAHDCRCWLLPFIGVACCDVSHFCIWFKIRSDFWQRNSLLNGESSSFGKTCDQLLMCYSSFWLAHVVSDLNAFCRSWTKLQIVQEELDKLKEELKFRQEKEANRWVLRLQLWNAAQSQWFTVIFGHVWNPDILTLWCQVAIDFQSSCCVSCCFLCRTLVAVMCNSSVFVRLLGSYGLLMFFAFFLFSVTLFPKEDHFFLRNLNAGKCAGGTG